MRLEQDKFRIFISHKHQDHRLARTVKEGLEKLQTNTKISCFVSGDDIAAAMDWNRTIKRELGRSHMLLLLYTNPALGWDWCLYETGLFTRFSNDDVTAVVALFREKGSPPRPTSNVQGVEATADKLQSFIQKLCEKPWSTTDDWRKGPLVDGNIEDDIKKVAAKIAEEFAEAVRTHGDVRYYPCHRVVLTLPPVADDSAGIPGDARVVVDDVNSTQCYTLLQIFGVSPKRQCMWRDLVGQVCDGKAEWRDQLDEAFKHARRREMFTPITAGFYANDPKEKTKPYYIPQLYKLRFSEGCAVGATVLFDRRLKKDLTTPASDG